MELMGVRVELPSNSPIVLLKETAGEGRLLPIFIGGPEATSIALALEEMATPRPMTHDLMKDILAALATNLEKVVITDLRDRTFFAELYLRNGETETIVSSRPSDALALAARTGAPVFASETVLNAAGQDAEPAAEEEEDEEVLEQFREFIDNISPDDFEG